MKYAPEVKLNWWAFCEPYHILITYFINIKRGQKNGTARTLVTGVSEASTRCKKFAQSLMGNFYTAS